MTNLPKRLNDLEQLKVNLYELDIKKAFVDENFYPLVETLNKSKLAWILGISRSKLYRMISQKTFTIKQMSRILFTI